MPNPFEDEAGTYVVLVNAEGQFSLWPERIEVPAGWEIANGPAGRRESLDYIEQHWTDMRPKSLVAQQRGNAA
ncbi:MbtH family protein [Catellatospora sichuanensis]|uniref:MbtH family protein n=1 Tax=Catellatospora sichuanensis TaxID=1969805 RepID=UPI001182D300|nr:MbtH family protein [Catellatospora sichuanensis]